MNVIRDLGLVALRLRELGFVFPDQYLVTLNRKVRLKTKDQKKSL